MKINIFLLIVMMSFSNAQTTFHTFELNGEIREYYLHLPSNIVDDAPLVFVFHGYSGSASGIMNYSGLNQIADENGFAVCYPQGLIDDWDYAFWNVGYDWHVDETVDDVGFIISLTQYLLAEYSLSTDNIFSTGMSNGGDMSYLLACEASDVFRAIAPVAGCMMTWIYDSCAPVNPLPVFEIHGTDDNVTWWEGAGEIYNDGWGPWESVDPTFHFWTQLNGCTESTIDTLPDINTSDGSYVISHKNTNGVNNNEVWLYEVVNGGHDWPGAYGNMDINASEEIWNFFTLVVEDSLNIHTAFTDHLPHGYILHPAYPNPFNPSTTLSYELLEQAYVNIIIYDLLGRQVKSLINQTQDAGFKSVIWNATNDYGKPLSAGVYLYQIRAGEFVQTKKMVLLK